MRRYNLSNQFTSAFTSENLLVPPTLPFAACEKQIGQEAWIPQPHSPLVKGNRNFAFSKFFCLLVIQSEPLRHSILSQKLSSAYLAKLLRNCNLWACHHHSRTGAPDSEGPACLWLSQQQLHSEFIPTPLNLSWQDFDCGGWVCSLFHVHVFRWLCLYFWGRKCHVNKGKKRSFYPIGKILILIFFSEKIIMKKMKWWVSFWVWFFFYNRVEKQDILWLRSIRRILVWLQHWKSAIELWF